jgi:hypothetical protein
MTGGKFLNQAGYSSKLISREGVRDDEDSTVGALVVEESNRLCPISDLLPSAGGALCQQQNAYNNENEWPPLSHQSAKTW